jgi:hypothetical protein
MRLAAFVSAIAIVITGWMAVPVRAGAASPTRSAGAVAQTTNPCDSGEPCFLAIFVDGAAYPSNYGWGDGIVTTQSTVAQPPLDLFEQGSWAAQFNADAGCADGYDDVGNCQAAGSWTTPDTVTLTAHPVPEGGFTPNPTPDDESPVWASQFVGWGGDCASAGLSPTCTIHIGTQQSTSGGYSLSVTAYFQEVDGPSPVGVPQTTLAGGYTDEFYSSTIGVDGGEPPYDFFADSSLPPGLNLDEFSGVISGTPTKTGIFILIVTVKDSEKPYPDLTTVSITLPIRQAVAAGAGCGGSAFTTSVNWSGYVATAPNCNGFTSVTGTWKQPTITCPGPATDSSFWVGLDGAPISGTADGGLVALTSTATSASLFSGNANYVGVKFDITDTAGDILPGTSIVAENDATHTATLSQNATATTAGDTFSISSVMRNSNADGHLVALTRTATSAALFQGILAGSLNGASITDTAGDIPPGTSIVAESNTTHTVTLSQNATGTTAGDTFIVEVGSVEQAGTTARCSGTTAQYYAWWEMFGPQGNNEAEFTGMTVLPGDTITATATFAGYNASTGAQNFDLTVRDARSTQTQTAMPGEAGANTDISCANPSNLSFPCARLTAEWIVEPNGTQTLAKFKPVTFSAASAVVNSGASRTIGQLPFTRLNLINHLRLLRAEAGPLTAAGNGFTDTWQSGPP